MSETAGFEGLIQEMYSSSPVQVWVPSWDIFVPFKPLTFEEHNKLLVLQTKVSQPDYDPVTAGYETIMAIDQLIRTTSLPFSCNTVYGDYNILDRNAIAIQLRVASDDKFTVSNGLSSVEVSLKEHVKSLTTIGKNQLIQSTTFNDGPFSVTVEIPSLFIDERVAYEITQYNHEDEGFPAFILLAEITKFITSVTFTHGTDKKFLSVYDFAHNNTMSEYISICKHLPLTLMKQITEFAAKVADLNEKISSFQVTIDETPEKVLIPINIGWFTSV